MSGRSLDDLDQANRAIDDESGTITAPPSATAEVTYIVRASNDGTSTCTLVITVASAAQRVRSPFPFAASCPKRALLHRLPGTATRGIKGWGYDALTPSQWVPPPLSHAATPT